MTRLTGSQGDESGQNETEDITGVFNRGWRQLSILPAELAEQARAFARESLNVTDRDLVIVVSHDCDVCSPNESGEPDVEVIAVSPLEGVDGNFTYLKNPRRLQTLATIGDESVPCELRAHRRWWMPRRLLLRAHPAGVISTSPPDLLKKWLARRYERPAFPNTFVERLDDVDDLVRGAMEQHGDLISGIFVTMSSMGELSPDSDYIVTLVGMMREEDYLLHEQRQTVAGIVDQIAAHLDGCEGISVEDSDVLSEAAVTLSELRRYFRLDYDTLSYRDEVAGPTEPFA